MGLLDKIFKSERDIAKEEIEKVPWKELSSLETLEKLEEDSSQKTVVVYKHSTRCGVSRVVLRNLEAEYDLPKSAPVDLYFLDLISHREVSNKIAEKFGVRHESPQLIIIKNGKAVYDASHQSVSAESIKKHVDTE